MRKVVRFLDLCGFFLFGTVLGVMAAVSFIAVIFFKRKKAVSGPLNKLSFAIFDLISDKYSSMYADAFLGDYIFRHYYIYLDFSNRHDRFQDIDGRILFHSIAAHPDNPLYDAGFARVSMLLTEIKVLARAFNIARTGGIGLVKSHDPHILGLNGLMVARWFRLPCVLHMNSDFGMKYRGIGRTSSPVFVSRGLEKVFEFAIIGMYDIVVADRTFYSRSASFPKRYLAKYRAFGVRAYSDHYASLEARKDLRSGLGLEGKKILLYVGRFHPVKYTDDAIKAFSIIKRSVKDAILLMVGSGALDGSLKDMVKKEGVQDSVLFLGPKRHNELPDIYYTADILLAPHGGLTLVESALAATPAVAYDFDWHSEFLQDSKMGFIVPFRNVERMAEKAVKLLNDDALREKMGEYCRETAISNNLRESSEENEKKIYDELLKR